MASHKDIRQLDLFTDIEFVSSKPKKKKRQMPPGFGAKMAAIRRGRKWSDAAKKKMSESHKGLTTGAANYNWTGGPVELSCKNCKQSFMVKRYRAKEAKYCSQKCRKEDPDKKSLLHRRIRSSVEYRTWRWAVFIRDKFTCQECQRCGSGVVLNADHIKPFALFPELRFEVSNGRTLCKDCHEKTPTFGVYAWRLKEFFLDQDGQ
jgi:5-methylcytosine-specific restriction endonuclease McrA